MIPTQTKQGTSLQRGKLDMAHAKQNTKSKIVKAHVCTNDTKTHRVTNRHGEPSCLDQTCKGSRSMEHMFSIRVLSPLPLSPKVMYSLELFGVRLENHLRLSVIWREQPKSMSHMFSKPPTCIINERKNGQTVLHWG